MDFEIVCQSVNSVHIWLNVTIISMCAVSAPFQYQKQGLFYIRSVWRDGEDTPLVRWE